MTRSSIRIKMISAIIVLLIVLSGCVESNVVTESLLSESEQVAIEVYFPIETDAVSDTSIMPTECAIPVDTVCVEETLPIADQIMSNYEIQINGMNYAHVLSDDSYWSKRYIRADQTLSIVSEESFGGLYVEWDELPGQYAVVWDGGRVECGIKGFFHEYISLPESVYCVEFEFPSDATQVLCDVEIFTEGTPPAHVQNWLEPCETADILVFPTHSDDDVLFFGPLISYYAIERRLDVQTAFMVEHRGFPERNHERLNGLWEMGVRHYPILWTAPDTSEEDLYVCLRYYKDYPIEEWQIDQIRRFKPLVVVGHDIEGEYGNGGHKVNTYYLMTAIEGAANEEIYPESVQQYGVWDTPKLYLHVYPDNEIILDVNTPLENDSLNRTPFEIATEAFKCHKSQARYGFRVQQGEWRANDCRPFGLYRTLVGYDSEPDVMENIDPSEWR